MKYLILLALLVFLVSCAPNECNTDADCVMASCCHASECASREKAPDCSEALCTLNCEPNTMDCGQGSCQCIDGSCNAVINEIR